MEVVGSDTGRIYHAGPLVARAGEGANYRVVGDASILLKIFDVLPSPRSVQKLELLTRYSPKPAHAAIPLETVVDAASREVVGFVQPFFDRAVPLTRALDSAGRRLLGLSNSLALRVKLCRLLSEAMARLHAADLVMGDVSDSNFLIQRTWFGKPTMIYVIDCNSLQLTIRTNRGTEFFPSGVATEAYTAPEVQPTDWSVSARTIFSDSFGLAVACWLLLFNGSHPFAVATPRNVDVPPLGERIEHRLFPYRPASPLPAGWSQLTLDPSLGILPNDLREMFFRTFSSDDCRDRPASLEWAQAFRNWEAKSMPRLPKNPMSVGHGPLSNRVANVLDGLKPWMGRGLVLVGILVMALFYPRFAPTSKSNPENGSNQPAPLLDQKSPPGSQSKPPRPRYVDRDLFPEKLLNPLTPRKGSD